VSAYRIAPARRRYWLVIAATVCALALVTTACSGGGGKSGSGTSGRGGMQVSITPANGSRSADPSQGITVTAAGGKLESVKVITSGGQVAGAMNAAGTAWHSTWALDVSQSYTVTARAAGPAGTVTKKSSFTTLTPSQTFQTEIYEGAGQSYGVGMPIILYFNTQITNKAAVERALQVTTSKPVVGAWYWDDPCNMAVVCAYFRPQSYWPADTEVSFVGHLNGVEGAPGVYGFHTLTQSFTIGPSLIVTASTTTHSMQVYQNGKVLYTWPISTGKPGDDTPNGTYLTISKGNPVDMVGPGYNIEVPWSVRFTWSGDYLHDAYWSVGEQGFTNVSHGCVNMAPADAEIYYNMELPGDPVTVTGSPTAGTWDNGWTMWFLPWSKWVAGSALHEVVEAGPSGSKFVSPSSVPQNPAAAPIGAPAQNNAAA
jgi:lipoprotein-anchoring transpeptidase ErfK/SrfK